MIESTLMTLPQQAMAKEKKVKYLGHYYNGEVNKKKIPEGHGVMNIGGLLIEGIFDDHSATDAEVNIWDFHNCQFKGNITYDSSNNITLKAGGVFTTEYYEETWKYVDTDAEIVEEVLEVDRVVNINSFERKTLEIPCRTGLNFGDRTIDSLINLNELVIPVKLQEKSFYYSNLTNPVQKNIFICPKRIETLHNYKED